MLKLQYLLCNIWIKRFNFELEKHHNIKVIHCTKMRWYDVYVSQSLIEAVCSIWKYWSCYLRINIQLHSVIMIHIKQLKPEWVCLAAFGWSLVMSLLLLACIWFADCTSFWLAESIMFWLGLLSFTFAYLYSGFSLIRVLIGLTFTGGLMSIATFGVGQM